MGIEPRMTYAIKFPSFALSAEKQALFPKEFLV